MEGRNNDSMKSDSTKVFFTANGRKVYGGGGILPDHHVDADTVTPYFVKLWNKGAFREYSNRYLEKNGPRLKDLFKSDINKFIGKFDISDDEFTFFHHMDEMPGRSIQS